MFNNHMNDHIYCYLTLLPWLSLLYVLHLLLRMNNAEWLNTIHIYKPSTNHHRNVASASVMLRLKNAFISHMMYEEFLLHYQVKTRWIADWKICSVKSNTIFLGWIPMPLGYMCADVVSVVSPTASQHLQQTPLQSNWQMVI